MLVAVLDIPFYDQLRRVNPAAAAAADSAVARRLGPLGSASGRRGRFLFRTPGAQARDVAEALTRLEAVRRELDDAKIRGHVCVVFEARDADERGLERASERLLLKLEASRRPGESTVEGGAQDIILHVSAAALLRQHGRVRGEGEFLRFAGPSLEPGAAEAEATRPPPTIVARPNPTNRIVEAAFVSLQEPERRFPVLVSGPDGVGKVEAVRDAARQIVGPASGSVVAIHGLFGRKSAVHPFLNSLRPDLLDEVPLHLLPWESRVWRGREALLRSLLPGAEAGAEGGRNVCPDRLGVDFYSAYRLYILAYARAMEARLLPALVIFEDIHAYHPEALRFCVSLIRDMLRRPAFLPILTCRDGHDACGVFGTDVLAVSVHPVSLREIKDLGLSIYPGLQLREKVARRIRVSTAGRIDAVRHCLHHLERGGKIRAGAGGFSWAADQPSRLPSDPSSAAWEEIRGLPRPAKEVLFVCALSGGILPSSGVLDLAASLDSSSDSWSDSSGSRDPKRVLGELEHARLIRGSDAPVFLYPRLKSRLKADLGEWSTRAEAQFAERIEQAWRSGRTRNLVLAFSVLRDHRLAVALDILGDLVARKLDELNVRGCRFFLDPARVRLGADAPEELRSRYRRIAAMGELRSHLLLGEWQLAEQSMDSVSDMEVPEERKRDLAQRSLEQSRFHLVKADAPAAAKAATTAVIQYHEAGDERGERRAEAELGAALLAEGRIEEAAEYLGFVTRAAACDVFPRVRAASLLTIVTYLLGNISGSIRLVAEAICLADEAGRREWQALLLFFRARQCFELGRLEDAATVLESLMAFADLYGMQRAHAIATAWLGRVLAYAGEPARARVLLERLGDTVELRLFRAEALYLQGHIRPALDLLEPIDAAHAHGTMHPGERVSWESGFASIEERCAVLRRDGGTLLRLVRGFRAYLTALDGRPEQGMRELYRITRVERVAEMDPYFPLYGYWYAMTLPDAEGVVEGTDHRLTVLNRTMKHFQQRSSRIESAADRRQLMTANYWNARLLEEARARRLV